MWLLFLFITPIAGVFLPFEQRYVSINGGPPQPVRYMHVSQLDQRKGDASKLNEFPQLRPQDEGKIPQNSLALPRNSIDAQIFGREPGLVSKFPTLIPIQEQLLYRKRRLHKKRRHRRHRNRRHRKNKKRRRRRRRNDKKRRERKMKKRRENRDEHIVENGPLTQVLAEKNGITSLTHKFDEKLARKSDPDIDNMRVERTERINLPDYTQETKISHNKHISPSTMAILQRLRSSGSFLTPTNTWATGEYQHPFLSHPVVIKRLGSSRSLFGLPIHSALPIGTLQNPRLQIVSYPQFSRKFA